MFGSGPLSQTPWFELLEEIPIGASGPALIASTLIGIDKTEKVRQNR